MGCGFVESLQNLPLSRVWASSQQNLNFSIAKILQIVCANYLFKYFWSETKSVLISQGLLYSGLQIGRHFSLSLQFPQSLLKDLHHDIVIISLLESIFCFPEALFTQAPVYGRVAASVKASTTGSARVLTSAECIEMLEEKKSKKKQEAIEKEERKKECERKKLEKGELAKKKEEQQQKTRMKEQAAPMKATKKAARGGGKKRSIRSAATTAGSAASVTAGAKKFK